MKTASSAAVLLSHDARQHELMGTAAVSQIAKDQMNVQEVKAQLRQSTKKAANALVKLGQGQMVLGHLQPRWLRREVERLLDLGEEVSFEDVAAIRARGPK